MACFLPGLLSLLQYQAKKQDAAACTSLMGRGDLESEGSYVREGSIDPRQRRGNVWPFGIA